MKRGKPVGRPKRHSGGYAIENAEELFTKSVEAGDPDYSYVAMAIGAMPGSPPPWAVLECINLRCTEQMKAARGLPMVEPILDDMVRHFDSMEKAYRSQQKTCHTQAAYVPPSLRSAIIHVAKANPKWAGNVGSADDDWMLPIREAWDWEQEHDLSPFEGGDLLTGFETTARIDRVVMEAVAVENDDPPDTATWAYLTKKLIERE